MKVYKVEVGIGTFVTLRTFKKKKEAEDFILEAIEDSKHSKALHDLVVTTYKVDLEKGCLNIPSKKRIF